MTQGSLTELEPAERHRRVAAGLAAVAAQVTDWDAPSPVPQWRARDVVGHLLEWFPGFLAGGGVTLPAGPGPDDPVAAWRHQADAVQALLDDPATAGRMFERDHVPAQPLAEAVDRFYTADVFMHTWDLGRAAGVTVALDPAWCAALLAGMTPIEDLMRASGQYGPAVEVPDDADPQTRLVAFIGRDPGWIPAVTRS